MINPAFGCRPLLDSCILNSDSPCKICSCIGVGHGRLHWPKYSGSSAVCEIKMEAANSVECQSVANKQAVICSRYPVSLFVLNDSNGSLCKDRCLHKKK